MNKPDALIVVGSGLAGYTFIREFRKLDSDRPIVLVTADDAHAYSKPMLSTGFAKGKSADQLSTGSPDRMAGQLNIDVRSHTTITAVDTRSRTLTLVAGSLPTADSSTPAAGEQIRYGDLVLAVGAEVVRPPFVGEAAAAVLSVNDLGDYRIFRERVEQLSVALDGSRALRVGLIGSGLIGCEFANDLLGAADTSFEVHVISPEGRPLQRLLPAPVSEALATGLARAGVKFYWDRSLGSVEHSIRGEIDSGFDLELTRLADGSTETLQVDIVLSATGLRPRLTLATEAGLETARGIVVDRRLQTSAQGVHALGDCAEVCGHLLLYVQPLMQCARQLAANLAGPDAKTAAGEVAYPAMPVIVKTPACPVVFVLPPEGEAGEWVIDAHNEIDVKALFEGENGQLKGFALSGSRVIEKQSLLKSLPALLH